jgi:hypothetical protein
MRDMLNSPGKVGESGVMQVANNAQRLGLLCVVDVNRVLSGHGIDYTIWKVKDWWRTVQRRRCGKSIFGPGRGKSSRVGVTEGWRRHDWWRFHGRVCFRRQNRFRKKRNLVVYMRVDGNVLCRDRRSA